MNHPLIPPDCIYFADKEAPNLEKYTAFGVFYENYIHFIRIEYLLEERDDYWRPIIAAVARCAWLDEGTRLYNEWHSLALANESTKQMATEIVECNKKSELWRVWGEQK